MDKITINFKASGQNLTADAHPQRYASNTVNYIQAVFDLDENWQSFDSVRAVWHNDFACISTVLDSDGACTVPHEVLTNLDEVIVNLVGSDVDGEELVDRMTTYPIKVAIIDANARICGTETAEVTPSQFEQFIAQVAELVGSVRDIDRIELNDDYTLTVYFSDGTSWTSTSIRGEQGETGNGIASAVLNDDYTLTLTFTDGTSYTTSSIRGEQGPQGEPGEVTLAQLESVLPTDTASGAIASFEDGSDLFDYLSCIVDIEPVQAGSGTPSPDNVRPITGWTGCEVSQAGVNLLNEQTLVSLCSAVKQSDGTYYISNLNSAYDKKIWNNPTGYEGQLTITFIRKQASSGQGLRWKVYYTDGTNESIGNVTQNADIFTTYTLVTNASKVVDYIVGDYGGNKATYCNIQIEVGSTATPYTPYNGTTYPVSWQTEAGTVYGGTVDVVTGVLTVTWAFYEFDGTENWQAPSSLAYIYLTGLENSKGNGDTTQIANWLVGGGYQYQRYGAYRVQDNGAITVGNLNNNVPTDTHWSTDSFKQELSNTPLQVCYELAQAQTYQLTPTQIQTLLGQNNVWADCGDVEVQYKADVQRWVEKMLNA